MRWRMTKIAIVGDYDDTRPAHIATNKAIIHAASVLPFEIKTQWVPTSSLLNQANLKELENYHGIWGSAGVPENPLGLINAIEVARTKNIPYLGTWSGFQLALVEYAKNVLRLESEKNQGDISVLLSKLIVKMSCSLVGESQKILLNEGSRLHIISRSILITEKHNCSYSLNGTYRELFEQSKLKFVGHNQEGDVRVLELLKHQFFLAMLFQPQLSSKELQPHPIIVAFLKEAEIRSS